MPDETGKDIKLTIQKEPFKINLFPSTRIDKM
jgi:hypothetical protein